MNKLYKHLPNHLKKRIIKKAQKNRRIIVFKRGSKYSNRNYALHDGYNFDGFIGFQRTVIDVAKNHSRKAALELQKIPRLRKLKRFTYHSDVSSCFIWSDTPQGCDLWSEVNKSIGGW